MPTLMASPAMKSRLQQIAPRLARPAPTPSLTDPEQAARHARFARRDTLFLRLRALSPALFATTPPPPLKLNIHTEIVERLGLTTPAEQRDLRAILATHTTCWSYLKTLATEGAQRHDLDGHAVAPVTDEHRTEAVDKLALAKATAKAAKAKRQWAA